MPIKFGTGQIGNPTPVIVKRVFRVILVASAAVALILQTVNEIPPNIKAIISNYLLELNAIVYGLSKLFGIEEEQPPLPSDPTQVQTNLKNLKP